MLILDDLKISNEWVDVNTSSSVAVGSEMALQNKSRGRIILIKESSTEPSADDLNGFNLYPEKDVLFESGSLKIWARSTSFAIVPMSVQG